jgi:cytochrome P450
MNTLESVGAVPTGPVIDPSDPSFVADPYPAYANVRESTPVWRPDRGRLTYVTRFADVHALFRDRRLGTTFLHRYTPDELGLPPDVPVWRDPRWADFQAFERWELLNLEPPVHTRMRRLVLEAFTPRTVEGLRSGMADRARALLEPGRAAGSIDLVGDYAQHFSLGIICALIGVPASDESILLGWSDATVRMYEPDPSDDQQRASNQAAGAFRRYLLDLVAVRRRSGGEDLLSALLEATVDGAQLTDDQIVSTAMVLLMAGHEAVVNATANGVALLAGHPDQWRLIRSGDIEPRAAIEEVLRFDPPLQWFERWVLDDGVDVEGVPIPRGSRVALVLAAANRDPRRHKDPDRFDITRGDTTHLSLGGGIHFCIGAPLARLELETTLTELARTEEELVVVPPAVRRPTFQFRGYDRLVIALSGAA